MSLSASERTSVLRITSIAEHDFLLLTRLACEYELFVAETACSRRPESRRLEEDATPAVETAASAGVFAVGVPAGAGRASSGAAGG